MYDNMLETICDNVLICYDGLPVLNYIFWGEDRKKDGLIEYVEKNAKVLGF
jgi:hypothetical protein